MTPRFYSIPAPELDFEKRLSPTINPKAFLDQVATYQAPCPWGELPEITWTVQKNETIDFLFPEIPLSLNVGCGTHTATEGMYACVARSQSFGMMINSDGAPPSKRPMMPNYIQMDLNVPETIHLMGMRVHAVLSNNVFTYDEFGVAFSSPDTEKAAAERINELLMPGGLFVNGNMMSARFDQILISHFGFRPVSRKMFGSIIQKPAAAAV